jgi:hypothetical protein
MWTVVYRSTGRVAFSSTSKAFAEAWLADNEYCPDTGKKLHLYELRKTPKKAPRSL